MPNSYKKSSSRRPFSAIYLIAILALSIHPLLGCINHILPSSYDLKPTSIKSFKRTPLPLWSEVARTQSETKNIATGHTGEVLATTEIHQNEPPSVISAGSDGRIILWDINSGAATSVSNLELTSQPIALGRRHAVIAWAKGQTVYVTSLRIGEQPQSPTAITSKTWELKKLITRVNTLAFHEDDSSLLIGGADGRIYRWHFNVELESPSFEDLDRTLERYIAHQTSISAIAPLHTGRAFFSADWDGRLYAWLAYTADDQQGSYDRNLFGGRFFGGLGSYMHTGRLPDRGITALTLSDNGSRLAVGTDDGYLEVWDVRGMEPTARSLNHNGRVVSVALSSDGSRVASLGKDGKLTVGDLVPDKLFGIRPTALRSIVEQVTNEELVSAKRIAILSNGDLLITTTDGRLGTMKLTAKSPNSNSEPLKIENGKATTARGSDY
jgi:WD40 repeat protein